jgi:hypothetical protein
MYYSIHKSPLHHTWVTWILFYFCGVHLLHNVHVTIFQTYTCNRNWEFNWCYYISLYHYMFRPLWAILRRIQYITFVFKHLRKSYRYPNGSVIYNKRQIYEQRIEK